jgi:penicillin-binding protein 1A
MNQIYLGQRAYGFASASEIYFGKPLKDITIAEAAMLAGLPKAPSAYNPIANPQRATAAPAVHHRAHARQRLHHAEQAERRASRAALPQPSRCRACRVRRRDGAPADLQPVRRRGLHARPERLPDVESAEQETAYRALRKGITDYERRQVYRGPEAYIDLPADPKAIDARIADALDEHPDNDEIKAAVVLEASPKQVVASLHSGDT